MRQDIARERLVSLLAAIVRGDRVSPDAFAEVEPAQFSDVASDHGVLALAAESGTFTASAPPDLQDAVRQRLRAHAFVALRAEGELKQLVAALDIIDARALLIKGAQLAYSSYAQPALRPRLDTDLFVPSNTRQASIDVLRDLGYAQVGQIDGGLLSYQAFYVKRDHDQVVHAVDLHWKISNRQAFKDVLVHDEAFLARVPLPRLHPAARGLCGAHALLLACIHRVAHHAGWLRLIWLRDIDLLVRALDDSGWDLFDRLAMERGIAAVCRRSLADARAWFGTPERAPETLVAAAPEPTAAYLTPHAFAFEIWDDFRALPNWIARWRLAREHLLPSARYMRLTYAPGSTAPLLALYARRIIAGAPKWLKRETRRGI